MKHIMLDTETLGTTADAVILSIGAVKFDLASNKVDDTGFYASVDIESNLAFGRRIQEDTLLWWLKQDAAAQHVFHEVKTALSESLAELSDWIGSDDYTVWSNGADFDLPMLAHAFNQAGMDVPWKFWNSRCFRTYKNLPGAKGIRLPAEGIKHNALSDALQQAQTVQAIHAAIFGSDIKNSKVKA